MDILKQQKEFIRESRKLNRQSRSILRQMKESQDHQKYMELKTTFDALQVRLDELDKIGEKLIEESEKPENGVVTPLQMYNLWSAIRGRIRLAKFGDNGVELPEIDVEKIFKGRRYRPLDEVTAEILSIIEKWQPLANES